jgi:hypothetical protein
MGCIAVTNKIGKKAYKSNVCETLKIVIELVHVGCLWKIHISVMWLLWEQDCVITFTCDLNHRIIALTDVFLLNKL